MNKHIFPSKYFFNKNDATNFIFVNSLGSRKNIQIDTKLKMLIFQTTLGFEAHQDTMKRSGSTAKNRYII